MLTVFDSCRQRAQTADATPGAGGRPCPRSRRERSGSAARTSPPEQGQWWSHTAIARHERSAVRSWLASAAACTTAILKSQRDTRGSHVSGRFCLGRVKPLLAGRPSIGWHQPTRHPPWRRPRRAPRGRPPGRPAPPPPAPSPRRRVLPRHLARRRRQLLGRVTSDVVSMVRLQSM